MITITYKDLKTGKTKTDCFSSLDKAEAMLEKIGPKTDKVKGARYALIACSWDKDNEGKLCEPYIFPEHEKEKQNG